MVFSSSYYYALAKMGNIYYFLIKDVIWVFLGIAIMFVFSMIDYHVIELKQSESLTDEILRPNHPMEGMR